MISWLSIKNFILIDELKLSFDGGFNVFTGETGAGKSILIRAIDIVLGAKAAKDLIKTGEEKAFLELSIKISDDFDRKILDENEIEVFDDELIISREILQNATRSRINGVLVTQEFVNKIRLQLVDIHSQNQTYVYIQPKYHIDLVDNYGGDAHKNLLNDYRQAFKSYIDILNMLEKAQNVVNLSQNQVDFLKFQMDEISDAQIEDELEDEKLQQELEILINAQTLKELTYSSYLALRGEDNSAINLLGQIQKNVGKANEIDEKLSEMNDEIGNCAEILKDVASKLRNYSENVEPDGQKMDFIQQRLDVLDKLKRKYGNSLSAVQKTYDELSKEYNSIEFSQDEIIRLEQESAQLKAQIKTKAEAVSQSRRTLASKLSEKMIIELEKLELPKVRFEVSIEPCEFDEKGVDKVEFLISTNISEPLRPLIKVASGGEISRIMLAIKTIFAKSDTINTIIFDEIDQGISGKACQSVADELLTLSRTHQVMCITHQPIIASRAVKHFYVVKDQEDVTRIKVYNLEGENKVKAIAMLASGEINDESLNFARQLINANNSFVE